MQDNELYSYFRERKDSFNEVPGDTLWAKIDAGLSATPAAPIAAKLTLLKKLVLAATTAITITGAILIYNANTPDAPEKEIPATKTTVTETGTQIIAGPVNVTEPTDTVKKKKPKPAVNVIAFKSIKDSVKTPSKPNKIAFRRMVTGIAPDSAIVVKPAVLTQQYGSTIKISTKEILSKAAFDTLVAQSLKTYRTQNGKILVVMADGHKPHRSVIGVMNDKQLSKIKGIKPVTDTFAATATISYKPERLNLAQSNPNLLDGKDSIITQLQSGSQPIIVTDGYTDTKIYNADLVDIQPRYPGGIMAFYLLLKNELKLPEGITQQTKIHITYVIEKDGSISEIKINEDVPGIQEQAERAMKKAKPWKPAKLNGKKVRYRYSLPFTIQP